MEVKADKKLSLKQNPATVWKVLTNPPQMVVSVPGAELTEQLDDRNFKGKIGLKIGPVTAKFNGEASFTKLEENDYEITLEGKGSDTGGKGGASMCMNIQLFPGIEGGTLMNSSMSLSITGKLAQFGSRMIVAVNNKLFDQWAKNFTDLLFFRVFQKGFVPLRENSTAWKNTLFSTIMELFPLFSQLQCSFT